MKIALIGLKLFVLLGCSYFIFQKVASQFDQLALVGTQFKSITSTFFVTIGLVTILMGINWLLEAYKWLILVNHPKLSLRVSINATLAAVAVGSATPRSVGDFIGRAMIIDSQVWKKMVVPTLVGRVIQLIPTLVFGAFGFIMLLDAIEINLATTIWILTLFFIAIGSLFLIKLLGPRLLVWEKLGSRISSKRIFTALAVAIGRYLVFTLQFFLLLQVFGTEATAYLMIAGITWVFLAKSTIPSFSFLSDLGVREFSAILFFSAFDIAIMPVVCASLTLWLINILLPTIGGLAIISTKKNPL